MPSGLNQILIENIREKSPQAHSPATNLFLPGFQQVITIFLILTLHIIREFLGVLIQNYNSMGGI